MKRRTKVKDGFTKEELLVMEGLGKLHQRDLTVFNKLKRDWGKNCLSFPLAAKVAKGAVELTSEQVEHLEGCRLCKRAVKQLS